MAVRKAGLSEDAFILPFCNQRLCSALITEEHWEDIFKEFAHYRQCRQTENGRATVLRDHDAIILVLHFIAYPKCTAAKINIFFIALTLATLTSDFTHPVRYPSVRSGSD